MFQLNCLLLKEIVEEGGKGGRKAGKKDGQKGI